MENIDTTLFDLMLPKKAPEFAESKHQFIPGYAMSGSDESRDDTANAEDVLDLLRKAWTPMAAKDIAMHLYVCRHSVYQILYKLEERGEVMRHRNMRTKSGYVLFEAVK